jgi:hypothetical protein
MRKALEGLIETLRKIGMRLKYPWVTMLVVVLVWASTGYSWQQQEVEVPQQGEPQVASLPQGEQTLEIPQVPKQFLGCWAGEPLVVAASGPIAPQELKVCFDPAPRMVVSAPKVSVVEDYQCVARVVRTGPDWVRFETNSSAVEKLIFGIKVPVTTNSKIRCQAVQDQLKCEGSAVTFHNGEVAVTNSWTATLDKE